MVKAKCIEKVRNKNNIIIGYTLQDNTGYTITVEPKQLKEKIPMLNLMNELLVLKLIQLILEKNLLLLTIL